MLPTARYQILEATFWYRAGLVGLAVPRLQAFTLFRLLISIDILIMLVIEHYFFRDDSSTE